MKKVISLVLAALMCTLALVSCGEAASKGVKVIDIALTDEEYAFGVDKDQPDLLTSVNEIIAEIKANGKLDEINNKYFGDGTPTPVSSAAYDESKDQLVVATNAAFEPFEYTDGDKYLGIDMEIAQLIAEKLGKELVINNMDFDAVCLSVGQHKCDIAMAGLTVNEERKEYVNFSDSYYTASQKIVVMEDNTDFDSCKTKEDVEKVLAGYDKSKTAGSQNGTTGQYYIEGSADWDFPGLPVTAKGYKNGSMAVQDMVNGNIDFVVIDSAPADCIAKAFNEMK